MEECKNFICTILPQIYLYAIMRRDIGFVFRVNISFEISTSLEDPETFVRDLRKY